MQFQDFMLTPLYLLLFYAFIFSMRGRLTDRKNKQYFIRAYSFKVFGAIAVGMIYTYYYGGGDTILYNQMAVSESFFESPYIFFKIVFNDIQYDPDTYEYLRYNIFYTKDDNPTYLITRITTFLSLFTFKTYTINAICFATFAFLGSWQLFRVFSDVYPKLINRAALAVFFLPSVIFWGSGLLKDTLTFGALGFALYGFYFGIIKRKNLVVNIFWLIFGLYTVFLIKIYILYCFIPALLLWTYKAFGQSIKSSFIRYLITPLVFIVLLLGGAFGLQNLTAESDYSFDKISKKTQVTATWLKSQSSEGGYYELGIDEYNNTSMLLALPKAAGIALFRPFVWEAGFNPVRQLAALEASYFIWLTILVFRRASIRKIWNTIFNEALVFSSLAFAISYAGAVAIATSNFGSLVRYKIPMMPFYIFSLYVILELNPKKQKKGSRNS